MVGDLVGEGGLIMKHLGNPSRNPASIKNEHIESVDIWNEFKRDSNTSTIVNFVSAATPFSRSPNFRVIDRLVQSTEAILLFPSKISTSSLTDVVSFWQKIVAISYEGKNSEYYPNMSPPEKKQIKLSPPTKREQELSKSKRPIGVLLDPQHWTQSDIDQLKTAFPDISVFLIPSEEEKIQEALSATVLQLCDDVRDGKGVQFAEPRVKPWENQFDTLHLQKKKPSSVFSKWWKSITNLVA